jgi:hypothetical protein
LESPFHETPTSPQKLSPEAVNDENEALAITTTTGTVTISRLKVVSLTVDSPKSPLANISQFKLQISIRLKA